MMRLYHASGSVCSQKARLAFAEKGLAYDSVVLDLGKGEQFAPDYLALNPDAVVPTLVDGEYVIRESSLILEYVDEMGPAPALMPQERGARYAARLWLTRTLGMHEAVNSLSFASYIGAMIRMNRTEDEIARDLANLPNPQVAAKRRDLLEKGAGSVFVEGAIAVMSGVFRDMAAALKEGAYLAGRGYGMADLALTAYVDRISRLGMEDLWAGRFDAVGDWLGRMRQRESYGAAIGAFSPPEMLDFMAEHGRRAWAKAAPSGPA